MTGGDRLVGMTPEPTDTSCAAHDDDGPVPPVPAGSGTGLAGKAWAEGGRATRRRALGRRILLGLSVLLACLLVLELGPHLGAGLRRRAKLYARKALAAAEEQHAQWNVNHYPPATNRIVFATLRRGIAGDFDLPQPLP